MSLSTLDHLQVLNTGRPLGQPLPEVTDRDSFDRAVRTRAPAVGNLHVGAITKQLGFLVRVPVIRERRVVYVPSTWLTSSGFATVLGGQAKLSDEWVRGIVDADGRWSHGRATRIGSLDKRGRCDFSSSTTRRTRAFTATCRSMEPRCMARSAARRCRAGLPARAVGFDAFFAKPADIPALLDALHRLSAAGQT